MLRENNGPRGTAKKRKTSLIELCEAAKLVWDTEGKEIEKEAGQKEEEEETRNFPTPELPRTMCVGNTQE